jgi:Flp pilus assembly protein TadG
MKALKFLLQVLLTVIFSICAYHIEDRFYSDICGLFALMFGIVALFNLFSLIHGSE